MGKEDADCAEGRGALPARRRSSVGLLYGRITNAVLASFYSVHTELGHGFLEGVYKNALAVMLRASGLRVEREVPFEIWFHGHSIGQYRADLIVADKVIVEVKGGRTIAVAHTRQVLNYLRASGLEVGLLLNFGQLPEFKRVVSTRSSPRRSAQSASSSAVPTRSQTSRMTGSPGTPS